MHNFNSLSFGIAVSTVHRELCIMYLLAVALSRKRFLFPQLSKQVVKHDPHTNRNIQRVFGSVLFHLNRRVGPVHCFLAHAVHFVPENKRKLF